MASGEDNPGRGDVFNAFFQRDTAVLMRPEGGEQAELAGLWFNLDLLVGKFSLAAGAFDIIQVPYRDQLSVGEIMAAAIDMPVVVLTGVGALDGVAVILEGTSEEGVGLSEFDDGLSKRAEQFLVQVFPVLLAAGDQVGGAFHAGVFGEGLADAPGVLVLGVFFEASDHLVADIQRQCMFFFEDEGVGFYFFYRFQFSVHRFFAEFVWQWFKYDYCRQEPQF